MPETVNCWLKQITANSLTNAATIESLGRQVAYPSSAAGSPAAEDATVGHRAKATIEPAGGWGVLGGKIIVGATAYFFGKAPTSERRLRFGVVNGATTEPSSFVPKANGWFLASLSQTEAQALEVETTELFIETTAPLSWTGYELYLALSVEPPPVRVIPQSLEREVTFKFTSLMDPSVTLADLPLNNPSFSLVLNGSGPWTGSLNVEDSEVRKSNWRKATRVNRSAMWVEMAGPYLTGSTLIYGGRTTGRDYTETTGIAALSGSDHYGYLAQRLQAVDYTEYEWEGRNWATQGAACATITRRLLAQALEETAYSIPITVLEASEPTPEQFWITFSAPRTQNQTLATMLSQLHQLGFEVGVDVIQQVEYVGGVPTVSLGVFYPRRGSTVAQNGLVIESRLDLDYQEDGTAQSNGVVEMAGGTGQEQEEGRWLPAMQEEEYPLLSQVVSHASVSPTTQTERVLKAYEEADLAAYAYPLTTPVVTLAMFGRPSILDLAKVGDNVRLRIGKTAGEQAPPNPLFPDGLDFEFRTVRLDAEVPDQGLPKMKVTLNIPPSSTPIVPPE